MAPPINVQDWYGDRHTCQIASGALACASSRWLHAVCRKAVNRLVDDDDDQGAIFS